MQNLETERLLLRPLTLQDSDRIEELAGNLEVAKTTLNIPYPYPKGSGATFIQSVIKGEENGTIFIRALVDKETEQLIGVASINIASVFDRGELGYWVGQDYWGKGYGTEAAKCLLEIGFNNLKLNRIFAAAFTNNPGSWRIMEKIGLKYEATLRQHVKRFGRYYDLVYYSLLREEY